MLNSQSLLCSHCTYAQNGDTAWKHLVDKLVKLLTEIAFQFSDYCTTSITITTNSVDTTINQLTSTSAAT